jgi:hypothetical protein
VCIAGADQTLLAAQLSSYFNEAATYFAVLEFPAAALPSENVPQKDDIGQMLMRRAATFINNCLAQFQPDKIILLGLPPAAQSCLRGILPPQKLVTVETEAELLALPFLTTTEPMKCKPEQAIEGLIAAKLAKRPLAFSEDAPDFPARQLTGKKGLILLESSAGVGEVAIVNYAASIDADIVVAPPVERFELLPLARQLQEWADDRSGPALRRRSMYPLPSRAISSATKAFIRECSTIWRPTHPRSYSTTPALRRTNWRHPFWLPERGATSPRYGVWGIPPPSRRRSLSTIRFSAAGKFSPRSPRRCGPSTTADIRTSISSGVFTSLPSPVRRRNPTSKSSPD